VRNRLVPYLAAGTISAILVAVLSACGSSGPASSGGASASAAAAPAKVTGCAAVRKANPSLVGKSISVGTDPSGPPFESINSSGKLVGFDVDLMGDIMNCLGGKLVWTQIASIAGLVTALQAGHISLVMSSQVATPARLKVVNYVGYLLQQEGFLVLKGNPDHIGSAASLCGHSVSVSPGSIELDFVNAQSAICTQAGKKAITPSIYSTFTGLLTALTTGRAQASILPPPYSALAEKTFPGKFSNTPVLPALNATVGVGVSKSNMTLENGVYAALKVIQAAGTEQSLMQKYQLGTSLYSPTKELS
jgi:polar amino acid transport system substrate-binding protein